MIIHMFNFALVVSARFGVKRSKALGRTFDYIHILTIFPLGYSTFNRLQISLTCKAR